MAEQTEKVLFRKNLDKRYISGEDLVLQERGLRKEMVVTLAKFEDAPAFDQKLQQEVSKTALWLTDLHTGKLIYKPCLLNVNRADFLSKEIAGGSLYISDASHEIPFVMYAKPDKRHGYIVAFKKYYPPAQITPDEPLRKLRASNTKEELVTAWGLLTAAEKNLPVVLAEKDKLKVELPSAEKQAE